MDTTSVPTAIPCVLTARSAKALARLFLKLMKCSHTQFMWSLPTSCLPITTVEEYQSVKDNLIKVSLYENDNPENTVTEITRIASKIFGKTMTDIIKDKFEGGKVDAEINTVDSEVSKPLRLIK